MGLRKTGARMISAVSTWGLRHVARRPAANLPGKIALRVDPHIISELTEKMEEGSIMVVGTNGKTTITNMIADALENQGKTIACNRTGANLASGVATTLLQTSGRVEWGVFESDELWLARTLPQVQATYVLLLNLFRDQLDRCGEIDRIQEAIIDALAQSPETVLIYNADDPLCAIIAEKSTNETIAFGVGEDMHLAQNTVVDAQMCQRCSGMISYEYRQYGQLGAYHCDNCGFSRPELDVSARGVRFDPDITFAVENTLDSTTTHLRVRRSGAYMVYNVLAAYTVAHTVGVSDEVFQKTVDLFDPRNGRLQSMTIGGRPLLLNLAKNPTGFNQNLKLITQSPGKKLVAFFINDNEADGRDISWIWDCDFEELCASDDVVVYAGGIRKNDLQLRLKYAGIDARLIGSVNEMVDDALSLPQEWEMYAIANYTALPSVRSALMQRADKEVPASVVQGTRIPLSSLRPPYPPAAQGEPLRIAHLFPDLLNLYGDGGNLKVLEERARRRGIPVEVVAVDYGDSIDLDTVDMVFLGGGPDREQRLASEELLKMRDDLARFVESDGVLLAICGGYQILGDRWLLGDETVDGLSLIPMETTRASAGFDRLIDNIVLDSPLAQRPVVGYENHAGRTHLGEGLQPFGRVVSSVGHGNDDTSGADGVIYRNCIGTYLHGPLLGKNPHVADYLLTRALERKFAAPCELSALDDDVEYRANEFMVERLKTVR